MKHPNWAANEMTESFGLFDKDGNGFVDPSELRRVFARLGENLLETELEDQLREFDIDGDLQVRVNNICKQIAINCGPDGGSGVLQDDLKHPRPGLRIRRQHLSRQISRHRQWFPSQRCM